MSELINYVGRLLDYLMYPAPILLHALLGGYIFYLLMKRYVEKVKSSITFLLGAVLGIFPDVLKFFGDLTAHSIPISFLYSLILAAILIRVYPFKFLKTWISITLTIIISHIVIDYLGNGVALMYPLVKTEYSFHIIEHDYYIVLFLLVGLLFNIIFKKSKKIIPIFLISLFLLFFFIGISKLKLDYTLNNQFKSEAPYLIISYPSKLRMFEWDFHVRTENCFYTGNSRYFPINIKVTNQNKFE